MDTRKYVDAFDLPESETVKSPSYADSPFARYERGQVDSFKNIVTEILVAYLEKHETTLTTSQKDEIAKLINDINLAKQYESVYTHLAIAERKFQSLPNLNNLLKHAKDYPLFLRDARKAKYGAPKKQDEDDIKKKASVYHNNADASVFETELALAILQAAPKRTSEKVNNRIIEYCLKHKERMLLESGEVLKNELIKYHICTEQDFESANPVDVFIALLKRPISDPVIATEMASLHLVFFNHNHIYKPEWDAPNEYVVNDIVYDRESVHRQVRPDNSGEMFEPETRGRQKIVTSDRSSEFGITTPEELPVWARDWHKIKYTPHKYRAGLHVDSNILQEFRKHNAPYIAGPSGTTADCMEGLHFLMPDMSPEEIKEYYNLLAAAEVGFGHHAMNEIILPLCNLDLFDAQNAKIAELKTRGRVNAANTMREKPWLGFDFQNSYEAFLSTEFKKSDQYKMLVSKYPQYFSPERNQIENMSSVLYRDDNKAIASSQRFQRAHVSYKELDKGTYWREAERTMGMQMNIDSFARLSKENLTTIQTELGNLTPEEKAFYYHLMGQPTELTHYTNAGDIINSSGMILSNTLLKKILGDGNFTDNSGDDVKILANGGNVFFRYELQHNNKVTSRFGDEHIIMKAETTPIFETGWVSLYEMLQPNSATIVRNLSDDAGVSVRAEVGEYRGGKITYQYGGKEYELDVAGTMFYGPDIRKGIALAMIRELRRIGGTYQEKSLKDLSPEAMNKLMGNLFRVEAKVPACINMDKVSYRYTAPDLMWNAVAWNTIADIQKLLDKGMSIDDSLKDGNSALFMAAKLGSTYDAFVFLFEKGARVDNGKQSVAHIAALHGNVKALQYCLDHGIDLEKRDAKSRSILSYALESGKVDVIEMLLSKGASINIADVLHVIKNGHSDILKFILDKFPEIIPKCIEWRDENDNSLAHIAAEAGYHGMFKIFIDNNIPINAINKSNQTILHLTVKNDSPIPDDIINAGKINIHQKDIDGNTVLHLASIENMHFDKYRQLGGDVNEQNNAKMTPLNYFIDKSSPVDLAHLYSVSPIDFTKVDNNGNTSAHRVIISGNRDAFRFIYEKTKNPNLINPITGESLLLCAIKNNEAIIALELIENGASAFITNKEGVSPINFQFSSDDSYTINMIFDKMLSKASRDEFIVWIKSLDKNKDSHVLDMLLSNQCLSHKPGEPTDVIETLLKAGANPHNIVDKTSTSTAMYMVLNDNAMMLNLFIANGLDVNFHNPDSNCLLHLAIANGRAAAVSALMDSGLVDLNTKNHQGKTAFDVSINNDLTKYVDLILSKHFKPDIETITQTIGLSFVPLLKLYIKYNPDDLFKKFDNSNFFQVCIEKSAHVDLCFLVQTAQQQSKTDQLITLITETKDKEFYLGMLEAAIELEDIELIKQIIKHCPDITYFIGSSELLKPAIEFGNDTILKELLNAGINPYAPANHDMDTLNPLTALDIAIVKNDVTALEIILSHDKALNRDYSSVINKSLMHALHDSDLVKMLLRHGADPKYADEKGRTALHEAVISYPIETVNILCSSTADINATDSFGETPLHIAVQSNKSINVTTLLNHRANPNIADKHGETALHTALINNISADIIDALIKNGADVNATANDRETPLHFAAKNGDVAIIKKLIDAGARIDIENADGVTPLQVAFASNNMEAVNLLLEKGANISHSSRDQYNVLHHIAKSAETHENLQETVKWLYEQDKELFNAKANDLLTPLHMAVQAVNVMMIDSLLQEGITIDQNAKDVNGNTPLHLVCLSTNSMIAKQLFESNKFDLTIRNNENKTIFDILSNINSPKANAILNPAFEYAVQTNQLEKVIENISSDNKDLINKLLIFTYNTKQFHLVALLLDKGADPNTRNQFGDSLFLESITNNNHAMTESFIKHKPNLIIKHPYGDIDIVQHLCNNDSNLPHLKQLYENGSMADYLATNVFNICTFAIQSNAINNLKYLLSITSLSPEQLYNLSLTATYNDNVEAMKILLDKINDPNIVDENALANLLASTLKQSATQCTMYLLNRDDINVNIPTSSGQTLVELALSSSPANAAAAIIQKSGINTQNAAGNTNVHLALLLNRLDVFDHLLLANAKVDYTIQNNNGQSILYTAIQKRYSRFIQSICNNPLNTDLRIDSNGNTIYHFIDKIDHSVLRSLASIGHNPNIENASSLTPLLSEIKSKSPYAITNIKTLFDCGADVNHINKLGQTPLSVAIFMEPLDPSIVKELLVQGADLSIESDEDLQKMMYTILNTKDNEVITNFSSKITEPIFDKLISFTDEDKDVEDEYFEQLVLLAIKMNDIGLLTKVLEKIPDIDAAIDNNNNTMLEVACAREYLDPKIIELLLSRGANPNGIGAFETTALIQTIKTQSTEITAMLLATENINVNMHDSDNLTPIHHAIRERNSDAIAALLEKGANIQHNDSTNGNLLQYAVDHCMYNSLPTLIAHGLDPFTTSANGAPAIDTVLLHKSEDAIIAIYPTLDKTKLKAYIDTYKNDILILSRLMAAVIANNDVEILNEIKIKNNHAFLRGAIYTQNPLIYAAKHGQAEVVAYMLENGYSTNVIDISQNTPLHHAVLNRKHSAAAVLLEDESLLEKYNADDKSPIELAIEMNDIEMTALLISKLKHKNMINPYTSDNLYNIAIKYNSPDVIPILAALGVDINYSSTHVTPIYYAAKQNNTAVIISLINAGATITPNSSTPDMSAIEVMAKRKNIDALTKAYETLASTNKLEDSINYLLGIESHEALYRLYLIACEKNDEKIQNTILNGANITIFIMLATNDNNADIISTLLKHSKANTFIASEDERLEAMQYAISRGASDALSVLLNNQALPNIASKIDTMIPPLSIVAIMSSNDKALDMLLDHGANPDIRDTHGKSLLEYAMNYSNKSIVSSLLMHDANPLQLTTRNISPLEYAIELRNWPMIINLLIAIKDAKVINHNTLDQLAQLKSELFTYLDSLSSDSAKWQVIQKCDPDNNNALSQLLNQQSKQTLGLFQSPKNTTFKELLSRYKIEESEKLLGNKPQPLGLGGVE